MNKLLIVVDMQNDFVDGALGTPEAVAFGSPSTEHSVMCSNYAVDGDEIL